MPNSVASIIDKWMLVRSQVDSQIHSFLVLQGSSSDSEGEEGEDGVSAKAFLKKKPEASADASKFLKTAKGSGVRGPRDV